MTWPFENNTNGIVKNLAKRNLKSEKRRNVMVIISVVLAAFLISLSGLAGVSLMQTEKKKVIDTYEATYVQVDETHIEELREVPEFARVGEYYMYGEEVSTQGFKGFFVYADKETMYMARSQMNLADGDLPEEKNEIVVIVNIIQEYINNEVTAAVINVTNAFHPLGTRIYPTIPPAISPIGIPIPARYSPSRKTILFICFPVVPIVLNFPYSFVFLIIDT